VSAESLSRTHPHAQRSTYALFSGGFSFSDFQCCRLKIGVPVTPVLGNVHTIFVLFIVFSVESTYGIDGQRDGRIRRVKWPAKQPHHKQSVKCQRKAYFKNAVLS